MAINQVTNSGSSWGIRKAQVNPTDARPAAEKPDRAPAESFSASSSGETSASNLEKTHKTRTYSLGKSVMGTVASSALLIAGMSLTGPIGLALTVGGMAVAAGNLFMAVTSRFESKPKPENHSTQSANYVSSPTNSSDNGSSVGDIGWHLNSSSGLTPVMDVGGGLGMDIGSGKLSLDVGGGMRLGMDGKVSFDFT